MAATNRVYAVFEKGQAVALVRAASQAQAIRCVVADRYEAIPADQEHLISLLGRGMQVVDAGNGREAEAAQAETRG